MPWAGKDRAQIEQELLAAVDLAKMNYEKTRAEHARLSGLATDAGYHTTDGILAHDQAHEASLPKIRALSQYETALRRFTEFVVSGKVPPETDDAS